MTLAEILKAKGIGDEIITGVLDDMKANKIYTANEENLDVRYSKLKTDHDGKLAELAEAQNLIAELKKSTKGQEDLQGKITTYEGQIQQLQDQLQETKIKSAVKVALLSEKALDVDYLSYKLESKMKEDGKTLELDDADNIKGWKDLLSELKTQFPNQFENEGQRKFLDGSLPPTGGGGTVTLEQFRKMGVEERSKFKAENETLYNQYKGN